MTEGPSIRKLVQTRVVETEGDKMTLEIKVWACDDRFRADQQETTYTSTATRTSLRKRLLRNSPADGEATFHHNLRETLRAQYSWRFEVNATLSDPL